MKASRTFKKKTVREEPNKYGAFKGPLATRDDILVALDPLGGPMELLSYAILPHPRALAPLELLRLWEGMMWMLFPNNIFDELGYCLQALICRVIALEPCSI